MKRNTSTQSGFSRLRLIFTLLLCSVGLLLALAAPRFGDRHAKAPGFSAWLGKLASSLGTHSPSQNTFVSAPGMRGGAAPRMEPRAEPERATSQSRATPPYAGPQPDLRPVVPVRGRPLRETPMIPPHLAPQHTHPEPIRPASPNVSGGPDTAYRQEQLGPVISAPSPTGLGFNGIGIGLGDYVPTANPPDVNGRIGATQYVQWNNISFAVFNKTTGALLYGPAAGNTLFQALGGVCASHNDGDPVVAYDILAGRWVLSQFVVGATPALSHQCIAISQTEDATGAYYLYDFVTDTTNFVDYPHIGVWPDGYYMTSHVFNAAGDAQVAGRVNVFEREKMIAGLTARQIAKDLITYKVAGVTGIQYGMLPSDLDSLTPPPAGEAAFVIGPHPRTTNTLASTRVAVTWGTTPTITLTETTIATGLVSPTCVNNTAAQDNRDCVPQPSPAVGADYLDNIEFHLMYRLAYRNFGGSPIQESLVASGPHTGSTSTPAHGAVRWWEFRNAGSSTTTPTVFQAATYDPDTAYRWLSSIAMDKDHNIALGYSKSSTSIKPGIYMTGRLAADTINTMGAETTVQAGLGVQLSSGGFFAGNRWGDYSAMTLDPIDQCTFWYTNEYLASNGEDNWATKIASYKFPSCTASTWGTVSGTIVSCATGAPVPGVRVALSNGFAGASNASGNYTISVPAGTYTATAADADRNCATSTPSSALLTVVNGGTISQNFCMSGSSNLQSNGVTIDDSFTGDNDGIISRDECAYVNLGVKNNGCASETAISATLTTTTSGVTVVDGSATYPNMVIDASGTNSVPFKIKTSSSFVCGTEIALALNLTYASGNKTINVVLPSCRNDGPSQTIPTSSLTTSDLTQADRLGRDGLPSTCSGKASPGGGFAGTKYYKTFTFNNSSGGPACFTVTINAALGGAGDIESAAYLGAYNPASLDLNYLGDSGITGLGTTVGSASYSFTVPAQSNFVVVVNTTGTTTSSQFSGTVSGFVNNTAGPGACPSGSPTPTATATATPTATATATPGGASPTPTPTPTPSSTPTPTPACLTDTTQAQFEAGTLTNVDTTTSSGDVALLKSAAAIDQQQTGTTNAQGASVSTTVWSGNTFTPAVSGQMTQLDVSLFNLTTLAGGSVTAEIRTTTSGAPTSTVLATATMAISGTASGFYSATFTTPATLTAGTKYAYTLRTTAGSCGQNRRGNGATDYAGGNSYSSTNSGGSWALNDPDCAFKTYMTTGYSAAGDLVSSLKDANPPSGYTPSWGTLSWTNPSLPSGTALTFQAAGSNSAAGPFTFSGSISNGGSLSAFNGFRYLKYKALLATSNTANTPTLNDVTVCFSNVALASTTLAVNSATGTFGGTVNPSATLTSSGNPVSGKSVEFTLNGNNVGSATTNASGVASLSNASLSGINAGTYPTGVGASFAGDAGFTGTSGTNSLTVNKANQTITFTLNSSYAKSAGTVALNGTATSGLAVTYGSSNTSVATVSGSTLTLVAPGSVTVTADQAGNTNYNAAPSVPRNTVITGPIAASDSLTRQPNSDRTKFAISNLLTNDTRIASDGSTQTNNLSISGVTSGTGNVVQLSGQWVFYTPSNPAASAPLTFTYTLSDGTSTATDTVTVSTAGAPTPFALDPVDKGTAVYNGSTTSITLEFISVANQNLLLEYSENNTTWTTHGVVNTGPSGDFVVTITASGDHAAAWNSAMYFRATRQ
jgi:hypothetical protein